MSGHSHARTVKHKKDANAKKRSQIFSKMARLISVAVKQGGPKPEINAKLRMAIDNAHVYNMPNENIERAIKRASGDAISGNLEEFLFEAYGPAGTALLIEGITDNKNRSLSAVKKILNQYNGKLVGEGAVRWMFERKGCVIVNIKKQKEELQNKEALELAVIEAGAEDIKWQDDNLDIYVNIEDLEKTKKALEERGVKIESSTLDWKPKEEIKLEEKERVSCLKLFDVLDENDDVQDIYSNIEL